ncbi:hypothetical protein E4U11_003872 [Claviceps purpurea]|nr:hypothetical protein E4U11_003872 [Claviceps purpurea]KAG6274121.1 hypothetical protein E4U49_005770 [Claviceps purpurea]
MSQHIKKCLAFEEPDWKEARRAIFSSLPPIHIQPMGEGVYEGRPQALTTGQTASPICFWRQDTTSTPDSSTFKQLAASFTRNGPSASAHWGASVASSATGAAAKFVQAAGSSVMHTLSNDVLKQLRMALGP